MVEFTEKLQKLFKNDIGACLIVVIDLIQHTTN